MPLDWSAAERVLATLAERVDDTRPETQLLIVTADAEQAASAAHAIVDAMGDRHLSVVAATSSPRAARLLKGKPSQVVVGAPADLVALLQASVLKPDQVRGVLFAWLDSILETPAAAPLENLLGELPKDGARVVLATELTPAQETLIERYARRARRDAATADEGLAPLTAEYVTTAASSRNTTLRRLLDSLDLPRAELFARTPIAKRESISVARSLGYPADAVRLVDLEQAAGTDPIIFVELPEASAVLRTLAGTAGRKIYAMITPSQLGSLRSMLGGGTVTPISLIEAAERARGKDAALRASLRDVLTSSDVRREVLALEPLLAEFDGLEIAAAALRMLEQQRPSRPAAAAAQAGPMQKLFVNLGEKDGVRAQEIITAISHEAGIPGSQVGRVEVRDTHSIVEVASAVSELVLGKINGAVVRGRKVQARLDQPREARPPRSGPPAKGGFDRSGPPRGRGGDRPERPRSFDGGDRPTRPARTFDRAERSDRPARPFDKGDRPARPGAPRSGPPRKFDREGGTSRPTRPRPPRDA